MQFGSGKGVLKAFYYNISEKDMNEIIHNTWKGGINWFDTAELFGRVSSDRRLSNPLKAKHLWDEDVVIATI